MTKTSTKLLCAALLLLYTFNTRAQEIVESAVNCYN
jgi:hypothetical protein